MILTRDMLLEQKRQLEADVYALQGAIQQVDWCLEVLSRNEEEDRPDKTR